MINKPQEGGNRKPSRLRFFLRLVLTFAVVGYCVFFNCKRCSFTAFADTLKLTTGQTLALYGTSIPAVYYNSESQHQLNVTFDYVGLSTDFVPPDAPNQNAYYYSYLFGTAAQSQLYSSEFGDAPFLRYRCSNLYFYDHESSSSVADNTFISSGSSSISQYNFTLDMSVTFDHVDTFKQMILVPIRSDVNRDDPSPFPNRFGQRVVYTSRSNVVGNLIKNPNGNIPLFVCPYFRPSSINDPYPDDTFVSPPYSKQLIYFGAYVFDDQNPILSPSISDYSISKFSFLWNWSGAQIDSSQLLNQKAYVEIWIQCPEITGDFTPPVVTTAPTTTTAPQTTRPPYSGEPYVTTPLYTYNLLPIESNQQVQIDIMNENLQYNAGTFDGINIIIKQLDDIYNAIKESGVLTVEQIAGLEWSLNTDVRDFVQNHITYTVASMNWNEVYKPVTGFYNMLQQYNFLDSFAVLGGVCLAFGVFCWFIFKGRGGG